MPIMDGVVATKKVKEEFPDVKVIILTTFDDDEFIFSALEYGASGYILKGISMEELHQAILTVNSGNAMLNPDIAAKVFRLFSQITHNECNIKVDESAVSNLLESEWQIIQQIANGLSNKEIADQTNLSRYTVESHIKHIYRKLAVCNRAKAIDTARHLGLLD